MNFFPVHLQTLLKLPLKNPSNYKTSMKTFLEANFRSLSIKIQNLVHVNKSQPKQWLNFWLLNTLRKKTPTMSKNTPTSTRSSSHYNFILIEFNRARQESQKIKVKRKFVFWRRLWLCHLSFSSLLLFKMFAITQRE